MEIIKLLIHSRDADYSLALAEALTVLRSNFIVTLCGFDADLAATDCDLIISDSKTAACDKRVIGLTDSYTDVRKNIEAPDFVLYKYSGLGELSSDILLYYSLITGKRNFSLPKDCAKVIVFCSASGGAGKTTIAFAAAQALRRYCSKSAIYISAEEFESTLTYMEGKDDGLSLCEYLYFIFKREGNIPAAEAFMVFDKYGTGAFMPGEGKNRIKELTAAETAEFFKFITESGSYDYILVDAGECFTPQTESILRSCHRAVAVLPGPGEPDEREKRFIRYLNFILGDKASEKIVIARNKITNSDNEPKEEGHIYIDFDPESFDSSRGITEISIDSDFGTGIKELVKRVL